MAFWALRGLLRGVVTTRYPVPSTRDEWATALPTPPRFVEGRVSPEVAEQVVAVCPSRALWLDGDSLVLDVGACTACGACRRAAPHAVRPSGVAELRSAPRRPGQTDPALPEPSVSGAGVTGGAGTPGGAGIPAEAAAAALAAAVRSSFRRSLHVRTVDTGSCAVCESEIRLLAAPHYDLHRLGFFFTPSPRHADLLLVTGPVTRGMELALRKTYDATPDPKVVVAVGACPLGGVFAPDDWVRGNLEDVLPVDVFVPGCPPSPLALLHGLLVAVGRLREKVKDDGFTAPPEAPSFGVPARRAPGETSHLAGPASTSSGSGVP